MATRRYSDKRQIYNYSELVNNVGTETLLCIDRSIIPVIIGLLSSRGMWRSTWSTQYNVNDYEIPDDSEFDILSNIISTAIHELQRGYSMALCDDLLTLIGGLDTTLQTMNATMIKGQELSLNAECGCIATGTNPTPLDASIACVAPAGFEGWVDYEEYSCKAVQWILEKTTILSETISGSYFWLNYDYNSLIQNQTSVTGVYSEMSQHLTNLLPLDWLYNLSDIQQSQLTTEMTNLYMEFRADKNIRVPDIDPIGTVLSDWYSVGAGVADYLLTNHDTIAESWYEETTAGDLLTNILATIDTAVDSTAGGLLGKEFIRSTLKSAFDVGISMLGFAEQPTISNWLAPYSCSGHKAACCPDTLLTGVVLSEITFESESIGGGSYEIDLLVKGYAPLDLCGSTEQSDAPTILTGSIERWRTYDDADDIGYDDTVAWVGGICTRRFRFTSSEMFTIEFNPGACL